MTGLLRRLLDRVSPARGHDTTTAPGQKGVLQRYAELCRAAGVDRLYLILTFDCDTDGDIDAVPALHADLSRRGINAGYAVPGAQLLKSPATWRAVAGANGEFLNHGGRAHAEFRDGRYWPMTFYEQLSAADVVADITAGHRHVIEVTGLQPQGFRAPHFGSFQSADQLNLIYETIKPLGYRYCSTTTPAMALSRGPIVNVGNGMIELPTMGSYRNPTTLLDSWTYLSDRTNYALSDEYFELFSETVKRMTEQAIPGLLTYYADPSHVAGQQAFERALDVIAEYKIPSLFGRDAVQRFRPL